MHPALDGVDAVGEGVQAIGVEAGVPLKRDLDLLLVLGLLEVPHQLEQRLLGGVEVAHEVDDAAVVLVDGRSGIAARTVIAEANLEAPVEERHHLEALEQRLGAKLGDFEDGGVGPEADGRSGAPAGGVAHHGQLGIELAAPFELDVVAFAVAVDLALESGRECVHHRHPNTVEPS